jgi:hypothetical protein
LAFGGAFMAVIFIITAITLLLFKCCCQQQGILSGHRIPYESSPLPRALFCANGVVFIIFAILLVTEGLTNLQDSALILSRSARDIGILAQEAENLIALVQTEIQQSANSVRVSLQQELEGGTFCPNDPTLENNAALTELRATADSAVGVLQNVDQIDEQVSAVSEKVAEAKDMANRVERKTNDIDITAWQSLFVLIPLTLVPCLLVAAAILAHFDATVPAQCVLHWFLLPVFIILVILCSAMSCFCLPLAILNADFCLPPDLNTDPYPAGSPDTTVYRLLDRQGFITSDDIVRQVANYYIGQCPADGQDPFEAWSGVLPTLLEGQKSLEELSGTLMNPISISELSQYCGRDYQNVQELLVDVELLIDDVVAALQRAWNAVSCDVWVPIYHRAVYDGACDNSLKALVWLWSSSMILAITGWMMLFLRSAYQPTAIQASTKYRGY